MLVCNNCHEERQSRAYPESQPLQHTGYTAHLSAMNCPDCGHKGRAGLWSEYLTAFELIAELNDTKEALEQAQANVADWPVQGFYNAAEMLHAVTLGTSREVLSNTETMLQVLQYAADCEAEND